ncbi:MAG: hypothetical protein M9904_15795 [Chitinophagaceae bacterium]|nr:hypothetical protein [Chitinophagaceae bacterium]
MKSFFISLIATLLITGCSKKKETGALLSESFPQKVIMVIEKPNDDLFYDYLTAPGSVVRRAAVDKTDEAVKYLFNSTHAPECVWIANLEGNLIYFQLAAASNTYLQVAPNRLSDEYMLRASAKNNDQSHLFRRHHIAFQNGIRIVALESVMYPGYFFSREGVVGENNAVKLVEKADPKQATKVRWYGRQM